MMSVMKIIVKEKIESQYHKIFKALMGRVPWYYKIAPTKYNKIKNYNKQIASKYSFKLGQILINHYLDKAFGRTYVKRKIVISKPCGSNSPQTT